jgi:hypothetical protein
MKLALDQVIKDFTGHELTDDKGNPATFRGVIETTLNAQSDAHPLTAEKKLFAFQIGVKILPKVRIEYDLTVDQVAFLKERIGLFFAPIVYGRFLQLIGETQGEEQ